jgi:hypothetical protein
MTSKMIWAVRRLAEIAVFIIPGDNSSFLKKLA